MNNEAADKMKTIHDVARELGSICSTVSRAISGKGRIGKATRERVLKYIEENDYYPNAARKALRRRGRVILQSSFPK